MKSGVVLANLVPDKDGIVRIPKDQLADRQDVHIVAIGRTDTVFRRVSLPDAGAKFRDLRLARPLEIAKHFTERKEVALLDQGGKLAIPDVRAAEMQAYDTLGSVYSLYMTRTQNATLAEFGFLLDWDALNDEDQRAKYSKYASHELSFFLSRKDPDFFKKVILPYLRNKKDKTFMDHYLLGEDLRGFVDPWRYSRLNMAERVLLADRLGGDERGAAKRHLADLYALIPPNPAERDHLFATALRGRSLSLDGGVAGGSVGICQRRRRHRSGGGRSSTIGRQRFSRVEVALPAPDAAPAAPRTRGTAAAARSREDDAAEMAKESDDSSAKDGGETERAGRACVSRLTASTTASGPTTTWSRCPCTATWPAVAPPAGSTASSRKSKSGPRTTTTTSRFRTNWPTW